MRKVTLLLGIFYLLWSIWQYFLTARLLSLYEEFGNTPQNTYLLPILLFIAAITFIGVYFANLKNQAIYKILVILGVLGIMVYFLFVFIGGFVAGRQVYQDLDEVRQMR